MSMTVQITMGGITDLEILMDALKEMGIRAMPVQAGQRHPGKLLASAQIQGHRIGFCQNRDGEITMSGDRDWPIMKDKNFPQKLRQYYSLAAVKKKMLQLRYHLVSMDTLENGSIKLVARAWR
jgi:hypothetical protein